MAEALVLEATEPTGLRETDTLVDRMVRVGDLRVTDVVSDTVMPDRLHERFAQFHNGVRIFGADVTRQTASGLTMSVFGQVYPSVAIDTEPTLPTDSLPTHMASRFGFAPLGNAGPELLILEDDTGTFRLVYKLTAVGPDGPRVCFVDAHTGAMVREYSAIQTNNDGLPCDTCMVGKGHGVKGDAKKISVRSMGGGFRTIDVLRPPQITTYDMNGDWERLEDILFGSGVFRTSDIGEDGDNNWTDGRSGRRSRRGRLDVRLSERPIRPTRSRRP